MTARDQLVTTAEDMLDRLKTGTITQTDSVIRIPASAYTDPELFEQEKRRVFRRVPLMVAAGCELANPGDYKAMDIGDVPILIVRGKDGQARTFLNACTHRGAKLGDGCGRVQRLTCPYHAWSFGLDGQLLSVASREVFGEVDKAANSLIAFPTIERAGLIWTILDPGAEPAFDSFLQGIDAQLAGFGFQDWKHFRTQTLPGANWKLAFDAHMDFYHLPVLHRNSFGAQISNLAEYYYVGPHQRLGLVSREEHVLGMDDIANLAGMAREDWPMNILLFGEWILFPNVSINCFYKGGRGVIISQILPGATVRESITVQIFLHEKAPEGDAIKDANEMADFLGRVVGEEDLPMSRAQQYVMDSGLLPEVQLGRNEGGLQQFHAWLQRFLEAPENRPLSQIMAQA